MEQVYFLCAVLGGTVFVCQFLMGLLGFGDHHDLSGAGDGLDHGFGADAADHGGDHAAGHDHDLAHDSAMSWFIGVLSFRTVVAGLTFFGLAGLAANAQGAHPAGSLAVAVVAGLGALYIVAWTMRSLSRLRADGTARIDNALGRTAVVYLTVPGRLSGKGKVTVTIQERTMEYEATTTQDELPTGASVLVTGVVDSETLSVESVPETARVSHV